MKTIPELHKTIAFLELGLSRVDSQNITIDKKIILKKQYITKIISNYEKIQTLIELKKADLSVMKREASMGLVYEVKYTLS